MAPTSKRSRSRQRTKARLWGAPDPVDFKKTNIGRALESAAKIHFRKRRDIDRLLALEKLAIDVFSDSASARAFATNPKAYMAQAGLPKVELDLNSAEVRLATRGYRWFRARGHGSGTQGPLRIASRRTFCDRDCGCSFGDHAANSVDEGSNNLQSGRSHPNGDRNGS